MLDFIPVVLKNLFSKPATRNYPSEKCHLYENERGHIKIDIDNCLFCGMCSRKCPAEAIKVDRGERTWSIDRFRCIVCSSCVESCPKKCLSMEPEYTPPTNVKSIDSFKGKPAPARPKPPVVKKPEASENTAPAPVKPANEAAEVKPNAEKTSESAKPAEDGTNGTKNA